MSPLGFLKSPAIVVVVFSCMATGALSEAAAPHAAPKTWEIVSSFNFNWDNQGETSVFVERSSLPKNDFDRVRIRIAGQKEFVLTNKDGWVQPKSAGLSSKLTTANVVGSDYVLAIKANKEKTLLLLFGFAYGSSPGSLEVLAISEHGKPEVVFQQKEFGLSEVSDLDGDGLAELVGYPCISQGWGNGLQTYDPFHVYKLRLSTPAAATLSLPLSKSYNLKHYYGWAGAKCSEEFAVVLHPPKGGKPVILTAKEAEKMTGGK